MELLKYPTREEQYARMTLYWLTKREQMKAYTILCEMHRVRNMIRDKMIYQLHAREQIRQRIKKIVKWFKTSSHGCDSLTWTRSPNMMSIAMSLANIEFQLGECLEQLSQG